MAIRLRNKGCLYNCWGAVHFSRAFCLASPLGLEPGIYGLTENSAVEKLKFYAGYSRNYFDVQYCV